MSSFGTSCGLHDDHLQIFSTVDLDENGFYHCDVCNRPLIVLHNGSLHQVTPIATIDNALRE